MAARVFHSANISELSEAMDLDDSERPEARATQNPKQVKTPG